MQQIDVGRPSLSLKAPDRFHGMNPPTQLVTSMPSKELSQLAKSAAGTGTLHKPILSPLTNCEECVNQITVMVND